MNKQVKKSTAIFIILLFFIICMSILNYDNIYDYFNRYSYLKSSFSYDIEKLENRIETLENENKKLKSRVYELEKNTENTPILPFQSLKTLNEPYEYNKEITVYITQTGSKYHYSGCQYLNKGKIAINKSDAIFQGYTPCSRCNP